MNKCPKCGTGFEGKFCPECGEAWQEEKTCPKCGATINGASRFCNECGYSFFGEETSTSQQSKREVTSYVPIRSGIVTLYNVFQKLPEILFILFSVLAFAFMATPVEKIKQSIWVFIVDIGNAYNVLSLSDVPSLQYSAIALLIFAIVGLVFALIVIRNLIKNRTSSTRGFMIVSFILELAFIIIAFVMIGEINKLDEGTGLISAGACPILFIVFPILFIVLSIACLLICRYLRDNTDVLGLQEFQNKSKQEKREQFYATHSEPVLPSRPTVRDEIVYKYKKRYYDNAQEKEPANALIWVELYKIRLCVVAVLLAIIIVIISVTVPILTSIFRISVVEKIELGYTQGQVREILGEPYEETKNEYSWSYYDKSLLSYVKKVQQNTAEQEKAFMQGDLDKLNTLMQEYEKLMEQVKSKSFKCIEIGFSEGLVTSVLLDESYQFEPQEKEIKNYKVDNESAQYTVYYIEDKSNDPYEYYLIDSSATGETSYKTYFTDGSYYSAYVQNGKIEWNNIFSSAEYTWSDFYGNYTTTISSTKVKIGEVRSNGVWSTETSSSLFSQIEKLVLPDSLKSISSNAFAAFKNLQYTAYDNGLYLGSSSNPYFVFMKPKDSEITSCRLNENTKIIANEAFKDCSALQSIVIPDSVTSIGYSAFSGCTSLTSVTIGNSVTYIGSDVFTNTAYYKNTSNWDSGILYIGNYLIKADTTLSGSYIIKQYTKTIANNAFSRCSRLTSITIPDSVTSIGNTVFYGCEGLTSITIPDSVTSIGNTVFYGCKGLTSITIPDSVISIGEEAFFYCEGLISVTIPDSVTSIGDFAFGYCTSLTSVTIPDSVTSIGRYAFEDCKSLTSVTIPDSVTSIGNFAFDNCTSLTSVYYKGTAEDWEKFNLSSTGLNSATCYYYSEGLPTADQWSESLNWWHYDDNDEIAIWTKVN